MKRLSRLIVLILIFLLLPGCATVSRGAVVKQVVADKQGPTVTMQVAIAKMATATPPGGNLPSPTVMAATPAPTLLADTPAPMPLAPTPAPTVQLNCAASFEHRELSAPYKRDKQTMAQRFTLATDELSALLAEMNIASLCIPAELGAPYLQVDWDSAKKTAIEGRMVQINFETSDPQSTYARGYLVYSSYNVVIGTEYDKYVSMDDYRAVQNGSMPNLFDANGAKGFARVQPSAISMGTTTVYQIYAVPFDWGYVALVYNLGFYGDDLADRVAQFQAGQVPEEAKSAVAVYAEMAKTIKLK